jgi:hypothetical protein
MTRNYYDHHIFVKCLPIFEPWIESENQFQDWLLFENSNDCNGSSAPGHHSFLKVSSLSKEDHWTIYHLGPQIKPRQLQWPASHCSASA